MCLAAVAIGQNTRFPWVLASNRDEFHDRPTSPLAWWQPEGDSTALLGGRDLAVGGRWLALRADGRLALVSNVREPGRFDPAAPSRRGLVVEGLRAGPADAVWLSGATGASCNGFNLLLADLRTDHAVWATNRPAQQQGLGAGVYGLSNASLNTPWPKVSHLKCRLATLAAQRDSVERIALQAFSALADRTQAADELLLRTGISTERERQLSSPFIHLPATPQAGAYGTPCSTVVVVEDLAAERCVHVFERRFDANGRWSGETAERILLPAPAADPAPRRAIGSAVAPGLAALMAWPVPGQVPATPEAASLLVAMVGLTVAVTTAAAAAAAAAKKF